MKFIVAFDTLCAGHSCVKDEQENPVLFDSADEAWREIADEAVNTIQAVERGDLDLDDYEEVSAETLAELVRLSREGTEAEIIKFFDEHPHLNDSGEFVVVQEEYQEGRKTIISFC